MGSLRLSSENVSHNVTSTATRPRNAELFLALWTQHRARLRSICRKRMDNAADAEDALSEIALHLWMRLPLSEDVLRPREWLSRLAHNLCIDLRRKMRHVCLTESLEALQETEELLPVADEPTPERVVLGGELQRAVHLHLETLPQLLREAAVLHFAAELPHATVADELGLSQANVRKRIERARALLRRSGLYSAVVESLE